MIKFLPEGRFKKALLNLMLLLIGGIAALFMGEVVVRTFCKDSSVLLGDPTFHHIHNKYFCGRRESPKGEYNVMVRFNSYGFRDYEYRLKKPEGTMRLVVLGDSFVDGLEVELEETVVKRLEKKLNESHNRDRCEVLNLGTQGYSPALEYLVLKNIGLRFNPDLIITCLHFTDIPEDYTYSQKMVRDKNGLPMCVTPPSFSQAKINFWGKNFLRVHSRIYALARSQYHNILARIGFRKKSLSIYPSELENVAQRAMSDSVSVNPYAVFKPDYSSEDERAWGLTCKFLLGLKSLADMSGSKLILVIIPAPDQVAPYEVREGKKVWGREEDSFILSTKLQDRLTEFCRQNRMPVLDLLPALRRASRPGNKLFFDYDGHFNNRGHQVVAEEMYSYLSLNKLVSPSKQGF